MVMSKPRESILCLVHRVPYPPNRGDRIRSFHVLEFLASRAEVHLAFLAEQPPPRPTMEVLERLCRRVAAVPLGRHSRWAHAAWSLLAGRTATEGLFFCRDLRRIVRRWAERTRFDAAFVFCSSMVQYLDAPGLAGVPAIVDLVDVDSQKWFDYAEHAWPVGRLLFRLEGRRLRRLEASLPDRAAAVTVVSEHEAGLFRAFCPTDRLHVIPNGIDLDFFRPGESPVAPEAESCVFVGALDYKANLDGVAWFCREVWPRVRQRHPRAVFRVVGSNPGPAARRLARLPGVDLVGEVADVRPYLREATIAAVPLRVARGIQNKVLEAMAMGKAAVVTPQALEGIDATPTVHLCQAATPDQWVRAIGVLLADPGLRNRLGRAARAFVAERYQWATQLERLAALPGWSGRLALPDRPAGEPVVAPAR